MKIFNFLGSINSSKSMLNRAQILSSYESHIKVSGFSNCEDVLELKNALEDFKKGYKEFNLGHGGTSLRFFALRVSREPGEYHLKASQRLLDRPMEELFSVLTRLGVEAFKDSSGIVIRTKGWKLPLQPLVVDVSRSSQFLSSLILNSWNLPFDLEFSLKGQLVSEPYYQMTLEMCKNLGLVVKFQSSSFTISKNQKINPQAIVLEPDMSSAFSVAALAALYGEAHFLNFPSRSLQPDFRFLEILEKMGASIHRSGEEVGIKKANSLLPIEVSLHEAPDLFPVLAVLCSFAKGSSRLYGAPQLIFKESQRIQKISELLNLYGVKNNPQIDGLVIEGKGSPLMNLENSASKKFNTDNDHRLAMAASLFKYFDKNLEIINPEVVNKSFPEFWDIFYGNQVSQVKRDI